MITLQTVRKRFVDVSWKDIAHLFLFVLAMPCAYLFKKKHPNLWLICEDRMEARDNGYWLFKYIRENHPHQEVYYAIDKRSADYLKVAAVGRTVAFGSFKHWIYYLAATRNISSQKGGNPNAAVCYLLEVSGWLKSNRVFLQHGITKDDMPWLYYQATRFSMFICGAKPEYDFVEQKFGYPAGSVQLTGFARFDGLHQNITDPHLILVMPTWRNWFCLKSNNVSGRLSMPEGSLYFKTWQEFISSGTLHQILEKYNLKLLFYPHRNMQQFINLFHVSSPRVTICCQKEYDVQNLLRQAQLLITDYSSVFFDMIYMKKPVLFYQFDEKEFRSRQYAQGYFDYAQNPFSIRYTQADDVLAGLETYARSGFSVSEEFLLAHKVYFPLYDTDNCKRILSRVYKYEN